MIKKKHLIWDEGEYSYDGACGFKPNIYVYLHEEEIRPCIIIAPGGGYAVVSPEEAEIVALKFYEMGYHSVVLTYTTNLLANHPLKLQPLQDLSRTVRYVRSHAEEWNIDETKVFLCGFSAGAHLCGSLCVHWMDIKDDKYMDVSNRPTGAILCYPLITSGIYAHKESFTALLGDCATEEELNYMSLEKWVSDATPPMFLWHTATDELVNVENSYLMVKALKESGVLYECHIFPKGRHGLSLANERWANREFGEEYTLEQTMCVIEQIQNDVVRQQLLEALGMTGPNKKFLQNIVLEPVKQVEVWPELAKQFIDHLE